MVEIHSKHVEVDGVSTHYLEAGDPGAPTGALLHSGELGAAAEISWEFTIPALAPHYHVIAPDWLGFGRTDKAYDFIGNSMGGGSLVQIIADPPPILPVRSAVLCSGGGFTPLTEARKVLLAYDCSTDAMRALLHDRRWGDDVCLRRQTPGTRAAAGRVRMRLGGGQTEQRFGVPDNTAYERVEIPVLIIAGTNDPLRTPGYSEDLARRIPDNEHHVYEECGHCPNIEHAERFNADVLAFLGRIHGHV